MRCSHRATYYWGNWQDRGWFPVCLKYNEVIYMSTTNMNIKTDSDVKRQAEELFAEFGLNMTTAVNLFLLQVVRTKTIPLELSLQANAIGRNDGHFVHMGEGRKNILDLAGNIEFADGYDHKALRGGADASR